MGRGVLCCDAPCWRRARQTTIAGQPQRIQRIHRIHAIDGAHTPFQPATKMGLLGCLSSAAASPSLACGQARGRRPETEEAGKASEPILQERNSPEKLNQCGFPCPDSPLQSANVAGEKKTKPPFPRHGWALWDFGLRTGGSSDTFIQRPSFITIARGHGAVRRNCKKRRCRRDPGAHLTSRPPSSLLEPEG